jgi:hypothetical protein
MHDIARVLGLHVRFYWHVGGAEVSVPCSPAAGVWAVLAAGQRPLIQGMRLQWPQGGRHGCKQRSNPQAPGQQCTHSAPA